MHRSTCYLTRHRVMWGCPHVPPHCQGPISLSSWLLPIVLSYFIFPHRHLILRLLLLLSSSLSSLSLLILFLKLQPTSSTLLHRFATPWSFSRLQCVHQVQEDFILVSNSPSFLPRTLQLLYRKHLDISEQWLRGPPVRKQVSPPTDHSTPPTMSAVRPAGVNLFAQTPPRPSLLGRDTAIPWGTS